MKKMEEYIQRAIVSPRRYRQLENIEMTLALQLPEDLGECCIVLDMLQNRIRRHAMNERLAGHGGENANKNNTFVAEQADGNVIRLRSSD